MRVGVRTRIEEIRGDDEECTYIYTPIDVRLRAHTYTLDAQIK